MIREHRRLMARVTAPSLRAAVALSVLIVVAGCAGPAAPSGEALRTPAIAPRTAPATAAASAAPTGAPTTRASIKRRPTPTPAPDLMLVAVGDSIAFNSNLDCAGCVGFVHRYGDALAAATGKTVGIRNLSQHNGLQVQGLLDELGDGAERAEALADADAIVVGIAHNDVPMGVDDDLCDGAAGDTPDWSKFTPECVAAEVKLFTPKYDAVFARIAELRAGKPTVLRALSRYNDWIGPDEKPESIAATTMVVAAWNKMICGAAQKHGFTCADLSTAFNGKDGKRPPGDLLAGDYTHPSSKGNQVIADVLSKLGFAPLQ